MFSQKVNPIFLSYFIGKFYCISCLQNGNKTSPLSIFGFSHIDDTESNIIHMDSDSEKLHRYT